MRTPISTIIGAIDTIKDNQTKISDRNRLELYSEIEIAAIRLNRHVENLLSMSRLEAGFIQAKKDWCDLNELIFSIINNNFVNVNNEKLQFLLNDKLPLFKLDRGLLEQIIHNLIHNAMQHTPENSSITIEVHHKEGNCIIEISDDGQGFRPIILLH